MPKHHLYYDKNDYKLIEILNDVLTRKLDHSHFKTLLTPYLRPHGIKELAASRRIRIAYAIMHLLSSLTSDQASERIKALVALRDDVLTAARSNMRNNRARVLIQIIKELIRAKGNSRAQLELAHDFRTAALGKTIFLREQLKKYHLLEMPEEWNQVAFDDRVHDANSKGRKSATHLIMDAWVKGIRNLTVVYYDILEPTVAKELFAAARILGIRVRIGIEYRAQFRGKYVKIVWNPGALQDDSDIRGFFQRDAVMELMAQGKEVQEYRTKYVEAVTNEFNDVHRKSIFLEFGVQLPPIKYCDVARTVGTGQPSLLHLGKHIHEIALPLFKDRVAILGEDYSTADYDGMASIAMQVESLDSLDADTFIARYLVPEENPGIHDPDIPGNDSNKPNLLQLTPSELTTRLRSAYHTSRLTLNLADLKLEDAVEILYDCNGRITHFEMFNLKTMTDGQVHRRKPLSLLQQAINEQNAVALKRMIRNCIEHVSQSDTPDTIDRTEKLSEILNNFDILRNNYKRTTLKTKIGSGSTGQSTRTHGMGFVVVETLPVREQRQIRNRPSGYCLPVSASATQTVEFIPPPKKTGIINTIVQRASRLPGLRVLFCQKINCWRIAGFNVEDESCGNVITLGGVNRDAANELSLYTEYKTDQQRPSLEYLNSTMKNFLKVLIGFIPAFLTFYLTKDWWVLAYLGGIIWFSITGLRNIIQSVLGGGGLHRSPYLRWNDYVSWDRISDSLLYTGFSVPLLDWLCKSVFLDQGFDINTGTNPILLYTIMAITNGIYISSHNLFRGLPKKVAFGNFFRSASSIPIAIVFNFGISMILGFFEVSGINGILQLWAAVISKLASDCVAGVIEGLVDRSDNIAMRHWDYSEKMKQVFETFSHLEILFPNKDMLKTLNEPGKFIEMSQEARTNYVPIIIANALDLLYIKMYQPRATEALRQAITSMTKDEREVFLASQRILAEEKEVARLFVDGLVGREFSKALSFYLLRHRTYLIQIEKMVSTIQQRQDRKLA
ncbi:MAG: hypothetical protein JEY79_04170 [Pseudodesulfovibrio sp.]|nr:hypothetical protein [Pseudodesulfovibrio sp.]